MPDNINNFVSLFADDIKLFGRSTTQSDSDSIQADLQKLQDWSVKWDLRFNEQKCKSLYLGKNNAKNSYKMGTIENPVLLEETLAEKDLGITIDNELSFKTHIMQAVKKANQLVGMICRTFTFLDAEMFTKLFTSLVRPVLEYGNSVWQTWAEAWVSRSRSRSLLNFRSRSRSLDCFQVRSRSRSRSLGYEAEAKAEARLFVQNQIGIRASRILIRIRIQVPWI